MRFWDSSALVPLVVRQPGFGEVRGWLLEDAEVVVWTLTPVEVVSALRRLVREGELTERLAQQGERFAEASWIRTTMVADVERAKSIATRLLRVHALKAADALQLAAALIWADGAPGGLVFHTFDARLRLAAEREGFTVVPSE